MSLYNVNDIKSWQLKDLDSEYHYINEYQKWIPMFKNNYARVSLFSINKLIGKKYNRSGQGSRATLVRGIFCHGHKQDQFL